MADESTTAVATGDTNGGAAGNDSSASTTDVKAAAGETQSDSLLAEKAQPEGEQKKDGEGGEKTDGTEGEEKKKDGEKVTPESYGDFEIPEGAVVHPELMAEFKQTMADEGFSKESAQKIINLRAKQLQQEGEAWKSTRKAWAEELKGDKEFGGEKFDATCQDARMALRKYDPDGSALKALMSSQYDNHPAVIRMLARINKAMGDDTVHTGKETDKNKDIPLHERLWKPEDMGGK